MGKPEDPRIGKPFRRRNLGKGDVRKHKCVPEVERTMMGHGKKTAYMRCSVCHVSMGSKTEDL